MGTSYSVDGFFSFKPNSKDVCLKELKEKFFTKDNVNFGFGNYTKYKSLRDVKDIGDAIKIVFADHQGNLCVSQDTELAYRFISAFDGSYGWEGVIYDFFKRISSHLQDVSSMLVWPESGCTKLSIKNGEWRIK